jgi:hypothetical protein
MTCQNNLNIYEFQPTSNKDMIQCVTCTKFSLFPWTLTSEFLFTTNYLYGVREKFQIFLKRETLSNSYIKLRCKQHCNATLTELKKFNWIQTHWMD